MNDIPPSDQVLPAAMPLLTAAEAAGALGAALRLRLDGRPAAPELTGRLDAVLEALGLRDAVNGAGAEATAALLGMVEGFLTQAADFVSSPGRPAWDYDSPTILMAQGHTSALAASVYERFLVPALGGDLAARLEGEGASLLDVGTGVGALAVAMCRVWPSLRVLGLDPWPPALRLAGEQVAAAGLEHRIELREEAVEALADAAAFDLAWVPTFFIPNAVLEPAIRRVHAALRPGGWATLGLYARPGTPLLDALADLRTVRQGGSLRSPAELVALLEAAGFSDVGIHFEVEWQLPVVFVAGRRRADVS